MSKSSVRIMNGNVDVVQIPANPKTSRAAHEMLLIRGVLDPSTLENIQAASYQREVMSGEKARDLKEAIKTSTVPDIELGMRGSRHRIQDDVCFLYDDVYVIDGLQRISAALSAIQEDPTLKPHIGCVAFFDTDQQWETERFRILNQERTKLSANVLIRNLRDNNEAISMLYKLATEDEGFALYGKVAWQQRMKRGELMPALVYCMTAGFLHSQFGPGRATAVDDVAAQLLITMNEVGRTTMRDNLKTFFEVIDTCFNLRHVALVDSAACIRRNFLLVLAEIFTRHEDFWRGKRLFVETSLQRKIAKFQPQDPHIAQLCSGTGPARDILYEYMLKHINSGKRTKRLTHVKGMEPKELASESATAAIEPDEVPQVEEVETVESGK